MNNPRIVWTLLSAAVIALSAAVVEAATITYLEDLREVSVEVEANGLSTDHSTSPSSSFASWNTQVARALSVNGAQAVAVGLQTSQLGSSQITGSGDTNVAGSEAGDWESTAASHLHVRFEVPINMWFTFEGQLSAFGPLDTATTLTLLHEQSSTLLIDETVQNANLINFTTGGALPAGSYELNLTAIAHRTSDIPGDVLTARALFSDVTFAVVPTPGAFAVGMVLLGGALLRRRHRAERIAVA